jgi:hypothetical protein
MKPFPNRTSHFHGIRLSPDSPLSRFVRTHQERYGGLVPPEPDCRLTESAEALRPAAALPATLGGRDATDYYGLSAPAPALVISRPILTEAGCWFRRCSCRKFCAALGALWTPWPGVPGLELASLDVRPCWLPLFRKSHDGCGAGNTRFVIPASFPHLLAIVGVSMIIGCLGFDISLTIAASVTWASWAYGSPAPLARVPTKLDLMPAMQGYPHSFGWVRTHLPYQVRQASLALRHGLAPRPAFVYAASPPRLTGWEVGKQSLMRLFPQQNARRITTLRTVSRDHQAKFMPGAGGT